MSSSVDVRQWFRESGTAEIDRHAREFGITFVGDNGERLKRENVSPPQRDVYEFDDSDDCNSVPERYGGIFMLNSTPREQDKFLRLLSNGNCSVDCGNHRFPSELRTKARLLSRQKEKVHDCSEGSACRNGEDSSRCSVVLDPLPSTLLRSLNNRGRVSVKRPQPHHDEHSDTSSESILEDSGARHDLLCAGGSEEVGVSPARYQRQESLLLPQQALDVAIDGGEEGSHDSMGTEHKSRHRKAENPRKTIRRRREGSVSSDSKIRKRSISCSTTSSTGSNVSGTKRRKHHHKHRHRRKNRATPETEVKDSPTPRVNPIFLWARQEDTRIVEVLCEDYDKRNRIRLTKTPNGWRAIPRTERLSSSLSSAPSSSGQTVSSPAESENSTHGGHLDEPLNGSEACLQTGANDTPGVCQNSDLKDIKSEKSNKNSVLEDSEVNISNISHNNRIKDNSFNLFSEQKCGVSSNTFNTNHVGTLLSPTSDSVKTNETFYDMEEMKVYNEFDDTDFESMSDIDIDLKLHISDDSQDGKSEHIDDSMDDMKMEICLDKDEEEEDDDDDDGEQEEGVNKTEPVKNESCVDHDVKTEVFIKTEKDVKTEINEEIENVKAEPLEQIKTEEIDNLERNEETKITMSCNNNETNIAVIDTKDIPMLEVLNENVAEMKDENSEHEDVKTSDISDTAVSTVSVDKKNENQKDCIKSSDTCEKISSIESNDTCEKVTEEESKLEESNKEETYKKVTLEKISENEDDSCQPTDLSIPKKCTDDTDMPVSKKRKIFANSSSFLLPPLSPPPLSKTSSLSIEAPISPVVLPAHQTKRETKSVFLESLLSSPSKSDHKLLSDITALSNFCSTDIKSSWSAVSPKMACTEERKQSSSESIGRHHKSKFLKPEDITLKNLLNQKPKSSTSKPALEIKPIFTSSKTSELETEKLHKSRLLELLTSASAPAVPSSPVNEVDSVTQLKQLLADPDISIPDPLLVPRNCLKELITNPGKEIPRLLSARPELRLPEALAYPSLIQDPDLLVISISQLQSVLQKSSKSSKEEESTVYNNLGTIIDWQQFQTQQMALATEFLEGQLKQQGRSITDLTPQELEVATTNALNQLLWLPYLNQLEAASVACGNTQEFINLLNAVFPPSSPPGPQPSQQLASSFFASNPAVSQDLKAQLELQQRLMVWQEAIAQSAAACSSPSPNSNHSKINTAANSYHRNLAANSMHQEKHSSARTNPVTLNIPGHHRHSANTQSFFGNSSNLSHQSQLQSQSGPSSQQYQQRIRQSQSRANQNRLSSTRQSIENQLSMENEYARRLKMHNTSLQNILTSSYSQKSQNQRPATKSPHQTNSHTQIHPNWNKSHSAQNGINTPPVLPRLVPIHHGSVPNIDRASNHKSNADSSISTSKSKAKQQLGLVDPSRLLKGMQPDLMSPNSTAIMNDLTKSLPYTNNNLWHPLFGSQKKNNSHWQWTTVTVNSE